MPPEDLTERRRREIADAAALTFAEQGYHATGIADIAQRLGIGHGTFYRYFKNKRDILEFVLDEVAQRLGEVLAGEDPTQTTTLAEYRAQVERIGNGLFDLFTDEPAIARLFYVESVGADHEFSERWLDLQASFAGVTAAYLRNGVERGFLPADLDVEVSSWAVNGMTFSGMLAGIRLPEGAVDRDRWVSGITRLMFAGISG
ncbi:MAG: TetR/AcrR family transcriptional regulator [Solirubrobacteraceae bacterium]|nr:TetR/AcrR family transcriptional regulator [Solirubrobacteraceae bacterium]